jgi:16S rRNA (uracil1498-N3)-methyltransferase
MDIPYFFEAGIQETDTSYTLSEATSKHCTQVLRMKAGAVIHLTNGKGYLFTAIIISIDKRHCYVQVSKVEFTERKGKQVAIGIGLIKNTGRFEWFIEKATELGIAAIYPIHAKRSSREHFRYDRTQQVMIAAMLQSQQTWLPQLHKPQTVAEVIDTSQQYAQHFIAHCLETEKQPLPILLPDATAQILIGPEGDFTEEEISLAVDNNYMPVTLGQTRLRTETAGVAAATLLMLA